MSENIDTIEVPEKGRYVVPPPQWLIKDDHGHTATCGAWSRLRAYRKGQRLLQDHLGRLPYAPLAVTPIKEGL